MLRHLALILISSVTTLGICHADAPKLFRERPFNAATLAIAVNHFVAVGQEAAIKELAELGTAEPLRDGVYPAERVGWMCRVLFEPKGHEPLRPPMYGALQLPYKSMPLAKWPLFPVALSGSSYFVLSEGYLLKGEAEDPRRIRPDSFRHLQRVLAEVTEAGA